MIRSFLWLYAVINDSFTRHSSLVIPSSSPVYPSTSLRASRLLYCFFGCFPACRRQILIFRQLLQTWQRQYVPLAAGGCHQQGQQRIGAVFQTAAEEIPGQGAINSAQGTNGLHSKGFLPIFRPLYQRANPFDGLSVADQHGFGGSRNVRKRLFRHGFEQVDGSFMAPICQHFQMV